MDHLNDEGLELSKLLDLSKYIEDDSEALLCILEICKLRNDQLRMIVQACIGLGITLFAGIVLSLAKGEFAKSAVSKGEVVAIESQMPASLMAIVLILAAWAACIGIGAKYYFRLRNSTYECIEAFGAFLQMKKLNETFKAMRANAGQRGRGGTGGA